MRPAEHVSHLEAGGSEQARLEAQERAHSPSPSFSGSYEPEGDDVYDSEDDGHGRESDRGSTAEHFAHEPTSSSAAGSQQKPKRTRQLTTPHQSAVLHALLARSRFPTTAMREEVGRQIGLSPRRVQVWFQNQRQKARKESKEAAAAAAAAGVTAQETRPPQFGPFTNVPPGSSTAPGTSTAFGEHPSTSRIRTRRGAVGETSSPITHESGAGPTFTTGFRVSEFHSQTILPSRRASEPSLDFYSGPSTTELRRLSGGNLTGPGVPGPSAGIAHFSQPSTLPSISATRYTRQLSPEQPLHLPPVHSITPPPPSSALREAQGPSASAQYQSELLEREASPRSLRLPPIQLSTAQYQGHLPSSHTSYSMPTMYAGSATLPPRQIAAPAPRFSHGRGERAVGPMSPSPIPPPFTLEPNPVWQPPSSASSRVRERPGPVSYSTPSSGSYRQVSGGETMIERRTLPLPTRTTRFDPVRDTEIASIQPPYRTHSRSSDGES